MAITPNTTFTAGNVLTAAQMNRLPWGIMGYAEATANQGGIGAAATDLTGVTVTFTATSTRYYRTTFYCFAVVQSTVDSFPTAQITDGSNNVKQSAANLLKIGEQAHYNVSVVETGLTGSQTRKARGLTAAGTMLFAAAATSPMFIVVEDIGQA